jgi:hypothetical protein
MWVNLISVVPIIRNQTFIMTQKRVTTKSSEAMQNVAEHYARELNAQFRTLNHFVANAGEIGRAHETFLRGILSRFLPQDIRVGSGFVASPKWTSRQQDILLHRRIFPILFEVGDCTVIDHQAFVGAIEVKTDLTSSNQFSKVIEIRAQLREQMRHLGLHAIYAWSAVSCDTALKTLWNFVRKAPTKNYCSMPDVVYVRGQYFLMANRDGDRQSPPYHLWPVNKDGITEGQALLGLVASVWKFGLNTIFPWWLLSWHEHMGMVAGKSREVPWPEDLKISIMNDIKRK